MQSLNEQNHPLNKLRLADDVTATFRKLIAVEGAAKVLVKPKHGSSFIASTIEGVHRGLSNNVPHQGKKECERRRRQMERAKA